MRTVLLTFLLFTLVFADNMLILDGTHAVIDTSIRIPNEGIGSEAKPVPAVVEYQPKNSYIEQLIESACAANGIDSKLAMSIAQVESAFNPKAVSATGAIGVMQVKVDQAVKDVYGLLWNKPKTPSILELHDPKTNIEIGVAYLGLIQNRFLRDIKDPKTKEYCTIASYNAGAGAVLRSFDEDRARAAIVINSLQPSEVLFKLSTQMQSLQGRRYLQKVISAKEQLSKSEKSSLANGIFVPSSSKIGATE